MKSKKKKYEKELLEAIKKHKIVRFTHAFGGFVSFCEATAYNQGLDKLESIKGALASNRAYSKNYLLQSWIKSGNSTKEIAAYRLMADPEEHRLLNSNTDFSKSNDKKQSITFKVINDSKDE